MKSIWKWPLLWVMIVVLDADLVVNIAESVSGKPTDWPGLLTVWILFYFILDGEILRRKGDALQEELDDLRGKLKQ